ncbi:MAG: hypothetical protein J0M08_06575 [Bacteroidetes bacterium]|nr:hypothetical protein [Bacteroidota bacterium]
MNRKLVSLVKCFTPAEINTLKDNYCNSPIVLKAIDFIEKIKTDNFLDEKIIEELYRHELGKTPIEVLQNRYYKLRKKLLAILSQSQSHVSKNESVKNGLLTEEEEYLYTIARTNKFNSTWEETRKYLIALETKAWQYNQFEKVNHILDTIINKNIELGQITELSIIKRKQKVSELLFDLNMLIVYKEKIKDFEARLGSESFENYLQSIKHITNKNAEYIRFKIFYHYICAVYKVNSFTSMNIQKVAKHIFSLKKLTSDNPETPILTFHPDFKIEKLEILTHVFTRYAWARFDFEELESIFEKRFKEIIAIKGVVGLKISDFTNIVSAKIHLKKYLQAWNFIKELSAFTSQDKSEININIYFLAQARIVNYAFPIRIISNTDSILFRLKEWVSKLHSVDDNFQKSMILHDISKLHLIRQEFNKALKIIEMESVKSYIKKYGDYELHHSLYTMLASKKKSYSTKFLNKIESKLNTEENKVIAFEYEWLYKIYNYYSSSKLKNVNS